jgi:hypothetical protein
MKQFIKKSIRFIITFIVVYTALIFAFIIIPFDLGEDYHMAFFDKQKLLENSKQHKLLPIILVGGSNTAFGFNSRILKDSLNRPIINTGLNTGLGLKFMLDHTSKYLSTGDIVIISPEYGHFFNTAAYGDWTLATIFHMEPSIWEDFNVAQFNTVARGISTAIQMVIGSRLATKNYKRAGVNEFGDYTAHWGEASKSYGPPSRSEFKEINTEFLNYYSQKVLTWRNKGIKVLIIPPPYAKQAYNVTKDKIEMLIPELEKRNINFIVHPDEFVYPDSLFFEPNYHLNYSGLTIRTSRVLDILRSCN